VCEKRKSKVFINHELKSEINVFFFLSLSSTNKLKFFLVALAKEKKIALTKMTHTKVDEK
jgi:hypothetical protein